MYILAGGKFYKIDLTKDEQYSVWQKNLGRRAVYGVCRRAFDRIPDVRNDQYRTGNQGIESENR